jgi:hypothetical protein
VSGETYAWEVNAGDVLRIDDQAMTPTRVRMLLDFDDGSWLLVDQWDTFTRVGEAPRAPR